MDIQSGLKLHSWRLIVDSAGSGSWNMAVDEMLLKTSTTTHTGILRFYQWNPATLSLGYFQPYRQRESHRPSADIDCLRRPTGGGAIVHDHELTYSLIFPIGKLSSNQIANVYDLMHNSLIASLRSMGIDPKKGADQVSPHHDPKSFLCFRRRTPADVFLNDHKIAGSAQRRNRNHVLQHGSVLMGQSVYAPELPGIEESTSIGITCDQLQSVWLSKLKQIFDTKLIDQPLTTDEKVAAEKIQNKKYRSDLWNQKR